MPFRYVISLGASCSAAYQIRRYFAQEVAFTFDWLITPFETLIHLVDNDLEGFIDPAQLAPYRDYFSVINTKNMALLHHDFPRVGSGVTKEWASQIPSVCAKYSYLQRRWRETLGGDDKLLFVRHQGRNHLDSDYISRISVNDANSLCAAIQKKHPAANFRVLFASAIDNNDQSPLHDRALKCEVRYTDTAEWPDPGDYWKGCSADWTAAFDRLKDME